MSFLYKYNPVIARLEVCESRDRKGLYKLAREGKIQNFTGISDPYESPSSPELIIETVGLMLIIVRGR